MHCRERGRHKQRPAGSGGPSEPKGGNGYLEMGARGPWQGTRGHEGAMLGPPGDCGRDMDFIPRATKPEKGTRVKVLPRQIPPRPEEKRLDRGSEWTPANLQCL